MSDTNNDFSGQAHNAVQVGTTDHVNINTQHVENGLAVQGDVHGGINLNFGKGDKK